MAEQRKDDAIKSVQVEALVSLTVLYVFLPASPGHIRSPNPGRGLRETHHASESLPHLCLCLCLAEPTAPWHQDGQAC